MREDVGLATGEITSPFTADCFFRFPLSVISGLCCRMAAPSAILIRAHK